MTASQTYLLDLVLPKIRYAVDDYPWQRAPKVYSLMHNKGHDPCGKDIVPHESIPRQPEALEIVELNIVLRDLLKRPPVCIRCRRDEV